jgi:release factor H-coupled RctB family protein
LKGSLNEGISVEQSLWLHRKGAAPADQGPVIIPGSRGHYSYLVLPSKDNADLEHAAYSLAHGAGRKWARGKALQLGKANSKKADALTTTELGSRVICENKDLLYEEVPAAYKEIETIIADLKSFKLISVIAIFKPLITYKTRVVNYGGK